MHSATQIIAQRAPPAIRTKTRWQPYPSRCTQHTTCPSIPHRLLFQRQYPNAFCSIISRQPPMQSTHQRIPPPSCPTHPTQSTPIIQGAHPTRRFQTQIYCWTNRSGVFVISAPIHWLTAFEYVGQAVNILSEIWRPQDVQDVFKAPSKVSPLGPALGHAMPLSAHQSLPSIPSSSHTSQPQTLIATTMAHQHSSFTSPSPQATRISPRQPITDENICAEVLKRSRTSRSIL